MRPQNLSGLDAASKLAPEGGYLAYCTLTQVKYGLCRHWKAWQNSNAVGVKKALCVPLLACCCSIGMHGLGTGTPGCVAAA